MQERHDLLARSIGYLDMEQEALDNGYRIFFSALAFLIAGTLLELKFFQLYNGSFHPFANILKNPGSEEGTLAIMNIKTHQDWSIRLGAITL